MKDENNSKPKSSSNHSTFQDSSNDSKNQISESPDFEINKEEAEEVIVIPKSIKNHLPTWRQGHAEAQNGATLLKRFDPLCAELASVYFSVSCSVDHSCTRTHARTRKTARKPKRTHLDKQTQAERERVELFWQMFACYHLRHSSQTNKLVITAMLHMRLEPSHSVCFLFLLLTMSPDFLSLPPSLTA